VGHKQKVLTLRRCSNSQDSTKVKEEEYLSAVEATPHFADLLLDLLFEGPDFPCTL